MKKKLVTVMVGMGLAIGFLGTSALRADDQKSTTKKKAKKKAKSPKKTQEKK